MYTNDFMHVGQPVSHPNVLCISSTFAVVLQVPANMSVLRIYCGHMYHCACIEQYVSNPPFDKGCCICGQRVAHHKLVTEPKVLEARWASQQARAREVADALDFLQL